MSRRDDRTRPQACLNCGSTQVLDFCAACGQRNLDMRVPARELALDAVEDGLSLDSRVGRTIAPFLFRPGFLTQEWTAGRRARFSSPLRLYLLTSFVFFLSSSLSSDGLGIPMTGDAEDGPVRSAVDGGEAGADRGREVERRLKAAGVPEAVAARAGVEAAAEAAAEGTRSGKGPMVTPGTEEQHAWLRGQGWIGRRLDDRWRELEAIPPQEVVRRVDAAFREWIPRVMFFLVPAAVMVLALLWRRRWLSEHVVLALHLHAFAFAVFTALLGLRLLPWSAPRTVLGPVLWAWLVAWFLLALHRVYGQPWRWTLPKAAVAALLYLVALGLGLAGVGALALWFA